MDKLSAEHCDVVNKNAHEATLEDNANSIVPIPSSVSDDKSQQPMSSTKPEPKKAPDVLSKIPDITTFMAVPKHAQTMALWGIIGLGSSAFVSIFDEKSVLKGSVVYRDGKEVAGSTKGVNIKKNEQLDREVEVYRHLPQHPHILHFYGLVEVTPGIRSLRLEYASHGDIRAFIRYQEPREINQRLTWISQFVSAMVHLHMHDVFHCDISCRNLLLDSEYQLKIADFGASTIGAQEGLGGMETNYQLPRRGRDWDYIPLDKVELFSVGCAIYEIMAWQQPHGNFEDSDVYDLYEKEVFPSLEDVVYSDIIKNCWEEKYESILQVQHDLDRLHEQVVF